MRFFAYSHSHRAEARFQRAQHSCARPLLVSSTGKLDSRPDGRTTCPSEYHEDVIVPLYGSDGSSFGSTSAESITMRQAPTRPSAAGPEHVMVSPSG